MNEIFQTNTSITRNKRILVFQLKYFCHLVQNYIFACFSTTSQTALWFAKDVKVIWELMVPPLSQKMANFYYFKPQKVGFLLILKPILRFGFFDMTRNPPLSLFLALLTIVFSLFCSNIIGKLKRYLELP